jgi:hypothetical protein
MKVFSTSLSGLNVPLAVSFLQHMGEEPWRLLSHTTVRSFKQKTLGDLESWIRKSQMANHAVFAHSSDDWRRSLVSGRAPAAHRDAGRDLYAAAVDHRRGRLHHAVAALRTRERTAGERDGDQARGEHARLRGNRAAGPVAWYAADQVGRGRPRSALSGPSAASARRACLSRLRRCARCLDLSKLPDGVRYIAAETLLRRVFRMLRMRGPIPVSPAGDKERFRLFVVVDEAKILSLGGGDRGRNVLNDLFTEARKFGLGMVLASQMAEHFSEDVRSNAATWLVLKPEVINEAKRNAPNVGVTPDQLMALNGRGDGYYRDRSTPKACRVQVQPLEA